MTFSIKNNDLRYIAGILSHLDIITATPDAIFIHDYANTRLLKCAVLCDISCNVGLDGVALKKSLGRVKGDTSFDITDDTLVIRCDKTIYRLRTLMPETYPPEPSIDGTGRIDTKSNELYHAVEDVRASGAHQVIIAITKDGAVLRGEGSSISSWIPIDAVAKGTGYSKLSLDILLPCIPKVSCDMEIRIQPKAPVVMQFGDMTYYQAPAI